MWTQKLILTGRSCIRMRTWNRREYTRSSQSIKIGIDLSTTTKIGKSDLSDIDCIDQWAEIDDTLASFIDLSWFLPISSIYIGRYICSSVYQKMKTELMQTVNLLTIELQLRVEGSNFYYSLKKSLKQSYLFFKIFWWLILARFVGAHLPHCTLSK